MASPVGLVVTSAVGGSFTGASIADSMVESHDLTPKQKRIVFILLVAELFTGQLGYAVFSPFFPKEGQHKDVDTSMQGLIFGVFQAVVLIFTPISMKLVPVLGPRALLNISNFLIGGANIAFALVWYIPEGTVFIAACFACRIVAGMGVSIAMVVGYGMLPFLFGEKLSTGSSILETAIGLAFIVAPVLGGAIYTAAGEDGCVHAGDNLPDGTICMGTIAANGSIVPVAGAAPPWDKGETQCEPCAGLGFVVPFAVLGGFQILLGILCVWAFPKIPIPESSDSRISNFHPRVVLPCLLCFVAAGAIEYMSPTLEPLLGAFPYDMSVAQVSLVFAGCSGVYVIAGPLVGVIDDKTEGRFALPMMGFGMLGLALGYHFVGPSLWTESFLDPSLFNMWFGIIVIGIATAFSMIPTYNNMYKWAKHTEEDDKANATSVLYNLFYAGGAWLGPTIGGMKIGAPPKCDGELAGEECGVAESYTVLGVFCAVFGVVVCVFWVFVRKSENAGIEEREAPLLDGNIHDNQEISLQKQGEEGDALASSTASSSSVVVMPREGSVGSQKGTELSWH